MATDLEKVWQDMIANIQIPEPKNNKIVLVFDGVSYIFSSWKRYAGNLCGEANSPPKNTPASRLIQLGENLFEYSKCAESREDELMSELNKGVLGLYSILNGKID